MKHLKSVFACSMTTMSGCSTDDLRIVPLHALSLIQFSQRHIYLWWSLFLGYPFQLLKKQQNVSLAMTNTKSNCFQNSWLNFSAKRPMKSWYIILPRDTIQRSHHWFFTPKEYSFTVHTIVVASLCSLRRK